MLEIQTRSRRRHRRREGAAAVLGVALVTALAGWVPDGAALAATSGCEDLAAYGSHPGTTVTIHSSIRDADADAYTTSLRRFEECTGIDIVWDGTAEFEAQLQERVKNGNPSNLAIVPQPGLLKSLVASGAVVPASAAVRKQATESFSSDWLMYGTVNGTFYAPPLGANVKSLLWYSPRVLAQKGWALPTSMEAVDTLLQQAVTAGVTPFCVGIESGEATGWPLTDWLEETVLRTFGTEVYDAWVAHQIPFDAPEIVEALDYVGAVVKNPRLVNGGFGGVDTVAKTSFKDAGLPVLDGTCVLHRQATFYSGMWPEGTRIAPDGDVYAMTTPIEEGESLPVLGGGEFVAAFDTKPETEAVQRYLGSAEWVNARARLGNWFSAHNGLSLDNVTNPIDRLAVQQLQKKTTIFRFDASDTMPAVVGAGTFWKGMTEWVNGRSTADTLAMIEESWPKS